MGKRGENIRLRKDKRWEGRCSAYVNGERKVFSVYAHSYKEAREKLFHKKMELQQMQQDGSFSGEKAAATFHDAAEEWLKGVEQKCKYSTYAKYRYLYHHYLYEKIGNLSICSLKEL